MVEVPPLPPFHVFDREAGRYADDYEKHQHCTPRLSSRGCYSKRNWNVGAFNSPLTQGEGHPISPVEAVVVLWTLGAKVVIKGNLDMRVRFCMFPPVIHPGDGAGA